jgi:hypothetical protein
MFRPRLAAAAVTISCGLMLVGGTGVASAQIPNPLPPTQAPATGQKLAHVVPITGTRNFKGTYTIKRFVQRGGKLYAVGTLKGKVRNKRVTKHNVRIPAALTSASGAQASQIPPTPGACQILNLQLAPIDLNLLGLRIRTNQINLLIEGVPGAGNLLGNLLCGLLGILDPNTLANTPLGQLVQILNALLALSPRTA